MENTDNKQWKEEKTEDTVRLLRECNAGVKMGISAIDDARPYTKSSELRQVLDDGHHRHEELGEKAHRLLAAYHDPAKEPGAMAKGMAKMKTEFKLAMHPTEASVADLISEGCSMGIRSLSKYLNQYPAADGSARTLAMDIISLEEKMERDLRPYL